ncbi:glycosyltransferase family 2 protein [Acinetobacter sp. ANC 4282]|uniref:glycosyltransferase family 2 protein n=1 Tax=Acinetobacter terrae TaxID=2731247 RepID=UPI00148FB0DA|nr:glycosyltransferase family 2 protein [Acinetobacter terrae]NNH16647.1 glycosyltransferase family 2 protein [Acinetobacter terrae]
MSNIKVSIFVPMYNVADFIEKCAKSLFMQTYENIEYIFVNDSTPDNTIEILQNLLEKFPKRKHQVKIIHHEVNKGIAATRNTGILNATGEYLLQVDGDDHIDIKTVELMLNKAIAEKADIVLCNYYLEFKKTNIEVKHGFLDKEQYLKDVLSAKIPPSIWNKLIRLEVYQKNNLLFNEGVNYGEDYMLVPQIIYFSKKISSLDIPLYNYIRWNTNSYTARIKESHLNNLIKVCENLNNFFYNRGEFKEFLNIGFSTKKSDLLRDAHTFKMFKIILYNFNVDLLFGDNKFYNFIILLLKNKIFLLAYLFLSFRRLMVKAYSCFLF